MAALLTRFPPPIYENRSSSPTMSPRRHGRTNQSSDESRYRELSPSTTLRAFTKTPIHYNNSDEHKIYACIETATPAEKDLGTRVAKAAQRLKAWCKEIEQWGWTGSFEVPDEEYREMRRKSVEAHLNEHITENSAEVGTIGPLEYWGSFLSVQVEAYEGRIEDMEQELETLEIEDLKGHILDIHGPNRSRPSSSYDTKRPQFALLDDFSILITQTLLQALPRLSQLKLSIDTWSARLSILRDTPGLLSDLESAQTAMKLGWEAIKPPSEHDLSDSAFNSWKEAIDTISIVLRRRVSDLGQRLDRMLDTLEGREDVLPEDWIDRFEDLEADYSQWTVEAQRRILEVEVRRMKALQKAGPALSDKTDRSMNGTTLDQSKPLHVTEPASIDLISNGKPREVEIAPSFIAAPKELGEENLQRENFPTFEENDLDVPQRSPTLRLDIPAAVDQHTHPLETILPKSQSEDQGNMMGAVLDDAEAHEPTILDEDGEEVVRTRPEPSIVKRASVTSIESFSRAQVKSIHVRRSSSASSHVSSPVRDRSNSISQPPVNTDRAESVPPSKFSSPLAVAAERPPLPETPRSVPQRPRTPNSRFRRDSVDSISSSISQTSSPQSTIEDSPSLRNGTNRQAKLPRPPLNSAMAKRRPLKDPKESSDAKQPWPPTQFAQQALSPSSSNNNNNSNSTDDLERQISNILTTIPAHIRLTSGPEADASEIKHPRAASSLGNTRSHPSNSLRASRAAGGVKSPELTLSPVKHDSEASSHAGGNSRRGGTAGSDSDIKLYHLTQPGKDKPIKLFVRRVGENGERVMVRVGGGWADLGEYLRQYAEHHGRRTVSEGKFEVLGLEPPGSTTATATAAATSATARTATGDASARPGSAASKKDFRFAAGTPVGGRPATPGVTPGKASALDAVQLTPSITTTPAAAAAAVGESGGSSGSSGRVSWSGNEVGLAGPKAKKLDLSGEKLEWIEGMINQARRVSGHVNTSNTGDRKSVV